MAVLLVAGLSLIGATLVGTMAAFSWYRIVPSSQAHLVITPNSRMVCSSDKKFQKNGGQATYFEIPKIPFVGRTVRKMDITIKELTGTQETYEKDQARYNVSYAIQYRVADVETAAESFVTEDHVKKHLQEIVQATVRVITVKYTVEEVRSKKEEISDEVAKEIQVNLQKYGLELVNFVLVDFKDTPESDIITQISKVREVEIATQTRELNAEKLKKARIKEAEADEAAQKREIARDEEVAKRQQVKAELIAKKQKDAETARLEVEKVQTVKAAEIAKEAAIVKAQEQQKVAEVFRSEQKLRGEGEKALKIELAAAKRIELEEQARGQASIIRERGKAEAEAKDKLQSALNKFTPDAIAALTAELVVQKDRDVGIATAEALTKAEVKLFAGSEEGRSGFNFGQMIESMATSNGTSATALLNRFGRPNDLGLGGLLTQDVVTTGIKKTVATSKKAGRATTRPTKPIGDDTPK